MLSQFFAFLVVVQVAAQVEAVVGAPAFSDAVEYEGRSVSWG